LKNKRILLAGYYGFDNAGDELLLRKTISIVQEIYTNPQICILYYISRANKSNINRYFNSVLLSKPFLKGCSLFDRFSGLQIIKQIYICQSVVFGGGGLFQDKTSLRSFYYYLFIIIIARLLKKDVFLVGQGIGPIKNSLAKYLFSKAHIKGVSLRDNLSFDFFKREGIKTKNLVLAEDLAYYKASYILPSDIKYSPEIGLSLRQFSCSKSITNTLSKFFSEKIKGPFCFLEFQKSFDELGLKQFEMNKERINSVIDMMDIFVNEKPIKQVPFLAINMRFHACIWSSLFAIPFLALAYDDKVIQISKKLGQEYIDLTQDKIDLNELIYKYEKINNQYSKYQDLLIKKAPLLIELSNLTLKIF
jgi:L-malate glycosyltransferase